MRDVTESQLEIMRLASPNIRVEERNGQRVALVPVYDPATDKADIVERRIVPDPETLKRGDLDPVNLTVRDGAVANPDGWLKSPLGHLFRLRKPPKVDE